MSVATSVGTISMSNTPVAGPPSGAVPVPGGGVPPTGAERARPGDSSKLTAASLINAIITHQINQTCDQRFPPVSVLCIYLFLRFSF